ncbi:MAG: hypothetical protein Q8R70_03920, partial [Methanoregula sp.]|nr:hypothetical protein [Methanoregula sp.]
MGDNDVSVKFVEVPLVSEMEMSSAMLMKDAYLPLSEEMTDDERYISPVQPAGSPHGDGSAGPNALVYVTKITNRTPPEVVEKILLKNPGRRTSTETPDFYTLVLTLSMRLGDPSTTRFLNGTIDLALPRGMKILTYSPKEKGAISAIIEQGGDALCLTAGLDISPSGAKGINAQ